MQDDNDDRHPDPATAPLKPLEPGAAISRGRRNMLALIAALALVLLLALGIGGVVGAVPPPAGTPLPTSTQPPAFFPTNPPDYTTPNPTTPSTATAPTATVTASGGAPRPQPSPTPSPTQPHKPTPTATPIVPAPCPSLCGN